MQKQRFSKLKALGLIALVIVSPLAGAGAAFALSNWMRAFSAAPSPSPG